MKILIIISLLFFSVTSHAQEDWAMTVKSGIVSNQEQQMFWNDYPVATMIAVWLIAFGCIGYCVYASTSTKRKMIDEGASTTWGIDKELFNKGAWKFLSILFFVPVWLSFLNVFFPL